MPILVSYDDINALGSAAIQGGYQPGLAEGQASYRGRQQQDQQMQAQMVQQQWQNEFQANLARQQQYNQQQFQAGQADVNRNFEAQHYGAQMGFQGRENEMNRQNQLAERLLQAQVQQQGQQAGFAHDTQMEQLRNKDISGRQAADDQRTATAKNDASDKAKREAIFNARIADPSLSAGDAERWYAGTQVARQELPVAREQQIQARTRGGANGGSEIGTFKGKDFQAGYLGVKMGGNYQAPLEAAQQILKPDVRAQMVENTIQGALTAIREMPVEQIVRDLPHMPQPIQQRVISMLNQQGQWSTGSNQAPQGQQQQPSGITGMPVEQFQQNGGAADPMEAELLRRGVPQNILDQIKRGG